MAAGSLVGQARGDGVSLSASGSWTAEYARTLEPLVDAAIGAKTTARRNRKSWNARSRAYVKRLIEESSVR